MQAESTVTARKMRNLGLSVFRPDSSSDNDAVPIQRNTPQTTAQLLPKPLPVPGVAQGSYFPQQAHLQQLQSPYTARPVQRQPPHPIHSASSSTITGRRMRNLGPRVFDPDNSSDDEPLPIQRNTPQTTAQLLRRPLPTVPGVAQGSDFPQQAPLQQLQSPYTARPVQGQPSHPIHSASSSASSISISTSLSLPAFQFPIGARQAGAQSSPDNDADEEEMGTMMPGTARISFSQAAIPAVITAKVKRISLRNAHAKSIQRGAPPQSNVGEDAQLNGAEEEEEYYFDSDSSEDDERFWNASSAPSATATPPAIKTSGPDDHGSSTLANLTLKPSTAATNLPTSRENSPSPSPPSGLTPTSGINRRASFRRDTWAFHPIQEDVLDHLQDFFPDHDLDKPFIDQVQISNEGFPSPGGDYLPAPVPAPVSKEAKFKHRKSIRFVAEERKKVLERVGSAREPSAKAANLGRKKSTKLWGSKVEEVTPGQVKRGVPPTIPESPTGPTLTNPTLLCTGSSGGNARIPGAPQDYGRFTKEPWKWG